MSLFPSNMRDPENLHRLPPVKLKMSSKPWHSPSRVLFMSTFQVKDSPPMTFVKFFVGQKPMWLIHTTNSNIVKQSSVLSLSAAAIETRYTWLENLAPVCWHNSSFTQTNLTNLLFLTTNISSTPSSKWLNVFASTSSMRVFSTARNQNTPSGWQTCYDSRYPHTTQLLKQSTIWPKALNKGQQSQRP